MRVRAPPFLASGGQSPDSYAQGSVCVFTRRFLRLTNSGRPWLQARRWMRHRVAASGEPPLGAFRRLCETQSAPRGCVDALVAVVPFDAIAGRWWAVDDLLYDSPARWSLRRFGLDLHVISCFQLHALTLLQLAGHRRDTRNDPIRFATRPTSAIIHFTPDPLRWLKMCERWMRRE